MNELRQQARLRAPPKIVDRAALQARSWTPCGFAKRPTQKRRRSPSPLPAGGCRWSRGGRRHAAHRRKWPSDVVERLRGPPPAHHLLLHVACTGRPAPEQCEGCTLYTSQVRELSFAVHSRDVTYATDLPRPLRRGPSVSRDFMGFEMPWYSAESDALERLLVGRRVGMMHIVCYLRQGSRVFETRTGRRGAVSRCWATAIPCSTSPSTDGRKRGRTPRPAGRSVRKASTITVSTGAPLPNGPV